MATLTFDDKTYDIDTLSDTAKAQAASLRFVTTEIERHKAQLAVLQTAYATYANALKKELEGAKH